MQAANEKHVASLTLTLCVNIHSKGDRIHTGGEPSIWLPARMDAIGFEIKITPLIL